MPIMPLSMLKKMLYTFLDFMVTSLTRLLLLMYGLVGDFMVMLMRASKCLKVEDIISGMGE